MALDSYTNLKAAVESWMHRSDTDFTDNHDDFIALTEAQFRHPPAEPEQPDVGGLRVAITVDDTLTMTTGTASETLPTDHLDTVEVTYDSALYNPLEYVSFSDFGQMRRTGSGQPVCYTIRGGSIYWDVAPDSDYEYTHAYYSLPTGLSGSNADNVILDNYPHCYLWGCLYHACLWEENTEKQMLMFGRWKQACFAANQAFKRSMLTQGALAVQTRAFF